MATLSGKTAIVTGASKGIGKAIAQNFAGAGAHVVLVARTEQELAAATENVRGRGLAASFHVADVGSETDVETLVSATVQKFGAIDILVNNAGVGVFKNVQDMTVEEFDTMWRVNVRGVFLLTRAVLPHMVNAGGGEIVNIASLAGKNSIKGGAGYCATKWALRGFASSLMLEVRDSNIRVSTIFPGSVDTSFSTANKRGRNITQPEDVADAVLFAVTAPGRSMFSEIDVRPTRPA